MSSQTNATQPMQAVDTDLVVDACCDCNVPLVVEKSDKESSRKNRCVACMMKIKLQGLLNK